MGQLQETAKVFAVNLNSYVLPACNPGWKPHDSIWDSGIIGRAVMGGEEGLLDRDDAIRDKLDCIEKGTVGIGICAI